MSRTTSSTFKSALWSGETSEAFLVLLTIDHDDLAQPIRVSSDGVDTTSNGNSFVAFPFLIQLPDDTEDRPPLARLTIDNVDRTIVSTVRALSTPPTVKIQVVLASAPSTIEVEWPALTMRNVNYDALTVRADLVLDAFTGEPFPGRTMNSADFPNLFKDP